MRCKLSTCSHVRRSHRYPPSQGHEFGRPVFGKEDEHCGFLTCSTIVTEFLDISNDVFTGPAPLRKQKKCDLNLKSILLQMEPDMIDKCCICRLQVHHVSQASKSEHR